MCLPKARAIGDRESRLMLEVAGRGNQCGDLLTAQHDRQCARDKHRVHLGHQRATIQRDSEEELKSRDGCVERDRRGVAIDQVQLKITQIFDGRRIRRAS
jgi:hypothetical protein